VRRSCGPEPWRYDHLVSFCASDDQLIAKVAPFVEDGLACGEAAVLVATPAHIGQVKAALGACSLDVKALEASGRLTYFDAAETLAQLSNGKRPDEARFAQVIGGALARAEAAAPSGAVRAYGEMVDLLWRQGNVAEAVRLEALWNELAHSRRLSLLCTYTAGPDHQHHAEGVAEVRRHHSATI
jgi:hypothetical protein